MTNRRGSPHDSDHSFTLDEVQELLGGRLYVTPSGAKLSGIPCPNPGHPGDNNSYSAYVLTSDEGHLRAICHTKGCDWRENNDAIRARLGKPPWPEAHRGLDPVAVATYRSYDGRPSVTEYRLEWKPGDPPCWWTFNYDSKRAKRCDNPASHKHVYIKPTGVDATGYPLLSHQPEHPHLELAAWIVYAEGARKADAIARAGVNAVSNLGGADGILRWNLGYLAGKQVIVWPDHDVDWPKKSQQFLSRIHSAQPARLILAQPIGDPGSKADAADITHDEVIDHLLHTVATASDFTQGDTLPMASHASPNLPEPKEGTGSADRTISNETTTTAHMCARLLQDHPERLVAVRPQDSDTCPIDARLLYVTDSGRLSTSDSSIRDLLHQSADKYAVEINRSNLRTTQIALSHKAARSMREPETLYKILKVLGGVIHELERTNQLPKLLTVCGHEELGADWTVLGAPNGVIDLYSGRLMRPDLALTKLVTGCISDDYEPTAQHPMLDQLLPLQPKDEMMQWYNHYLGWSISHHVNKDIVAIGSPTDSGKTSLLNADVRSMGSYVTKAPAETFIKPKGYAANPSAHNDGKAKLDAPARRTFIEELARPFNAELANELSGGGIDQDYRIVGEKRHPYRSVAHMVFMYNTKEYEDTLMPLDGSSVGDALDRRLYTCLMSPIPRNRQNSELLDIAEDGSFRQAYVARIVELAKRCLAGHDHNPEPPPGCPTMRENKAMLARQAEPPVQRDFIPNLFVQRRNDDPEGADSYTAYQLYLEWHKDEGELGPPLSKTAFTQMLKQHYGGPSHRGKKIVPGVRNTTNSWFWPDLTIA